MIRDHDIKDDVVAIIAPSRWVLDCHSKLTWFINNKVWVGYDRNDWFVVNRGSFNG